MVLGNSRYPLVFEFLILCCALFFLLLVAGMGMKSLLGLSAGPLGGFGLEIRAGTPRVGCEPRELAGGQLSTAGCASKGGRFFWAPATALLSRQA